MFSDAYMPMTLRPAKRKNRYTMVDSTYVAGLDVGLLSEAYKKGELSSLERMFVIE